MRAHINLRDASYALSDNEPKETSKRPEPISVLGLSVAFQGSVQINTRGSNIAEGKFEMYDNHHKRGRVYGDVSEMGEVIVALTTHCVSVHIW